MAEQINGLSKPVSQIIDVLSEDLPLDALDSLQALQAEAVAQARCADTPACWNSLCLLWQHYHEAASKVTMSTEADCDAEKRNRLWRILHTLCKQLLAYVLSMETASNASQIANAHLCFDKAQVRSQVST